MRPFGLDVPATALAADAVETAAGRRPKSDREPVLAPLVRFALRPLAAREERLHRRRKEARVLTPRNELRRLVRDMAGSGKTVVAGPWTGDDVGELLYWIPFLRWAVASTLGFAARLVVVARPVSASWYEGLDVRLDAPAEEHAVLDPAVIERSRGALAATDPWSLLHERRLEFARLELPSSSASPSVFVGPWGAAAVVAVLSGAHAVVWGVDAADPDVALLGRVADAHFGRLDVASSHAQAVERAALLSPEPAPASAR